MWPNSVKDTGYINNKFVLNIIEYITSKIYNNCDLILVQSKKFIKPVKHLTSKKYNYFNPSEFTSVKKSNFKFRLKKIKDIYYAGNIGSAQNLEKLVLFCRKLN